MSDCVREMTNVEQAESIVKQISENDINAEFLYKWQIDFIKASCEKQIPKSPIILDSGSRTCYKCQCGNIALELWKRNGLHRGSKTKFCERCGQAMNLEMTQSLRVSRKRRFDK